MTECRLITLFKGQEELTRRFMVIEEKNGFDPPSALPVNNLDDPKDQLKLKELAWRATEEIGEAVNTMTNPRGLPNDASVAEEFSDVLHFLLELFIVAGIDPLRFPVRTQMDRLEVLFEEATVELGVMARRKRWRTTEAQMAVVVWDLADAMHELKNRPWKQTLRPTDRIAFLNKLQNAMGSFILACLLYGIATQELFDLYFKKHAINRNRQDSGV